MSNKQCILCSFPEKKLAFRATPLVNFSEQMSLPEPIIDGLWENGSACYYLTVHSNHTLSNGDLLKPQLHDP